MLRLILTVAIVPFLAGISLAQSGSRGAVPTAQSFGGAAQAVMPTIPVPVPMAPSAPQVISGSGTTNMAPMPSGSGTHNMAPMSSRYAQYGADA